MTRFSEAYVAELLRKPGYRAREQSSNVSFDVPVRQPSAPPEIAPRTDRQRRERDVLEDVLAYLARCRCVAWFERMNCGGKHAGGQYVRFGFPGCSDIIGQLRDGRFLAIECKRPGKNATPEQWQFLCDVNRNNGVAFVACGVADVQRALA